MDGSDDKTARIPTQVEQIRALRESRLQGGKARDAALSRVILAFCLLLATNVFYLALATPLPEETPLSASQVATFLTQLSWVEGIDTLIVLVTLAAVHPLLPAALAPPANQRTRAWLFAPLVLAALLACNYGYHWWLLRTAGVEPEADAVAQSGHYSWWCVALYCVQPSLVEELFFRGVALGFLNRHTTTGNAVVASSVMFAAAHTGGMLSLPVLFLCGLVFAWAKNATGGLLLPMLLHFSHNLLITLYDG